MRVSLIVAAASNGVIGRENTLPWRLPADLRHFRSLTMGKPVVMGRRTWESIGKPLPGRRNIVVTRDPDFRAEGCTVVHGIEQALAAAADADEVMIMGGAQLYDQLLPLAGRVYLTQVHAEVDGDARFPLLDPAHWVEVERHAHGADENNEYDYDFVVLERRRPLDPA